MAKEYILKFRQYCKENELRYTKEREKIVEQIFKMHYHFTADELFVEMYKKNKTSRASVFRTLNLLIDCGFIKKTIYHTNKSFYEHIFGHNHHDHLICLKCNKVIEINDKKLEKRQTLICDNKKFKPVSHNLNIFGYCEKCRK